MQISPAAQCPLVPFWSTILPRRLCCTYLSRDIILTRCRAVPWAFPDLTACTVLKSAGLSFCGVPPTWVLPMIPHDQTRAVCCWQEDPKVVLGPSQCIHPILHPILPLLILTLTRSHWHLPSLSTTEPAFSFCASLVFCVGLLHSMPVSRSSSDLHPRPSLPGMPLT